jgi:hexosaminidase
LLPCVLGDPPVVPDYNQGGYLWPLPQSISQTTNLIPITSTTFKFQSSGQSNGILTRAFTRYMPLFFPVPKFEAYRPDALTVLNVNVAQASESDQIQYGADESYTISVSQSGASLQANTVFGALRGLETFSQLIITNATGYYINETSINDYPRFQWRGLLIDSSRHWLPVDTILETISAMAYSKLNTLHWHIVDGQSFPYQSAVYPMLSLSGAYRQNQVYSIADIKKIISFANDNGIRVLPEFDMPAHASSWGFGYDFMTIKCFGRANDFDFNDGWGDSPMDPTNPAVYTFLENFLTEASTIFPDNWLHLGGDEVNYQCWNTTAINQYMAQNGIKTYQDLETMFIAKVNTFIKGSLNKNLIYWQEVFQHTSPFIGSAVDVWIDANTLSSVIAKQIQAIQSFGWYLDHLNDNWATFYKQEPIPPNTPPALEKYVIGGEASMWGETVDSTNIHQKVWPRACSAAERLWSAKTVNDTSAAIPRLSIHRCRYVQRGIPAQPFQPGPGCY